MYLIGMLYFYYCSNVLDGCMVGISPKGYLIVNYHIGSGIYKINNVCRMSFLLAYQISDSHLQTLCKSIKERKFNAAGTFSDRTSSVKCNEKAIENKTEKLKQLAERMNFSLSKSQLSAVMIPNKPKYLFAYAWLERYFDLVGDQELNCNEIHLEPVTLEEVYVEYLRDTDNKYHPNDYASKKHLTRLWLLCFP